MNKLEVAALLTIAAGFDRFMEVGELNTNAWHVVLADINFGRAKDALIAYYRTWDGKTQLAPSVILGAAGGRLKPEEIEADVRSAKMRGLIDKSWPVREPLPVAVGIELEERRKADRANPDAWMQPGRFAVGTDGAHQSSHAHMEPNLKSA